MQDKIEQRGGLQEFPVIPLFPTIKLRSVFSRELADFFSSARSIDFYLSREDVHFWIIMIDNGEVPTGQLALLSEDEEKRASMMATPLLKSCFISSRCCLRCLLSLYIGTEPRGINLTYNNFGKPGLDSGKVYFNLSHSGDLAVVAFSGCNELGVDIERVKPISEALEIARNYFSRIETSWISAVAGLERWKRFLRCWVIREACVKAIGTGLSIPLNSFEVRLPEMTGNNQSESFYGQPFVVSVGSKHRLLVREFLLEEDYLGALAVLHKE